MSGLAQWKLSARKNQTYAVAVAGCQDDGGKFNDPASKEVVITRCAACGGELRTSRRCPMTNVKGFRRQCMNAVADGYAACFAHARAAARVGA